MPAIAKDRVYRARCWRLDGGGGGGRGGGCGRSVGLWLRLRVAEMVNWKTWDPSKQDAWSEFGDCRLKSGRTRASRAHALWNGGQAEAESFQAHEVEKEYLYLRSYAPGCG